MFKAFAFRNFRLYFGGQLISLAGSWMQMVAQQWLVFTLTKSAAWLGVVSGASALPYVLLAAWGGHVADRYPRRTTLVITQTAAMVLAFALWAVATNRWIHAEGWHIALLAALGGVVNAFNNPAQQAFVTEMVEDRAVLGNAIALNSLMFNMARFLGPVLAGAVLVKWGAAACFFVNGVSFLAVIASLLMMRLPAFVRLEREGGVLEGFRYVWRTPQTLRVVALVGALGLFAWSFSTLFPVFAEQFHRGAAGFSMMTAINGVGAALGGITMAAFGHRLNRRTMVYGGAALFVGGLLLFSAVPSYYGALSVLLLTGFAMIAFAINANTKVQEDVSDALRGRVMAVYSMVFMGLMPAGGLEIGLLAEHVGAVDAVRINAVLGLLVTAALFAWSEQERRAESRGGMPVRGLSIPIK